MGTLWDHVIAIAWFSNAVCNAVQDNEAAGSSGNNEEAQPSLQCPWELFDADLDPQQAAQEGPKLDAAVAERLKQAVDTMLAWEQFEVFVDLLPPDAAYPTDSGEAKSGCGTPSRVLYRV